MSPSDPLAPRPEPVTEEAPAVQLCAFRVGAEEYAIDVMRLDEVLRPQKVTPVAGAPAFVQGVVNLRGTIVPVIDVRARLGAAPPRPDSKPRLLVCRLGRGRVALPVDAVSGIVRARRDELRPAPLSEGLEQERPLVVGVFGPPERLRLLLNVKALTAGGRGEAA